MKEITLEWGRGYSGKWGKRCWVARLVDGEREFLDAAEVRKDHHNRYRTTIRFTYRLGPGRYEVCEAGTREIIEVAHRT